MDRLYFHDATQVSLVAGTCPNGSRGYLVRGPGGALIAYVCRCGGPIGLPDNRPWLIYPPSRRAVCEYLWQETAGDLGRIWLGFVRGELQRQKEDGCLT